MAYAYGSHVSTYVTGAELVRALGWNYRQPHSVWWRIESGERGLTPEQLGIVALMLGVTTDWLIYGSQRLARLRSKEQP